MTDTTMKVLSNTLLTLFLLLLLPGVQLHATAPGVTNCLPSDYGAGNKNWSLDEDESGTYYMGNDRGLLEFDGLQWRLYELPRATIVRSVAVLSHEVIFTGGFEEFGRWDRDMSGVLRYTSLVPPTRDDDFSDSDFWRIFVRPEGVFFQSFHSIYFYDYKTVRRLPGRMNMLFLLQAGDEFWVQEMGGPLYRMTSGGFEPIAGSERFSTTTVRVLLPSVRPNEWIVGTGSQGLWRYDGREFQPCFPAVSESLCRDELNCGIYTSRGTYLFGTLTGGIYEIDTEGRLLNRLSTGNRLLNDCVLALSEDVQGNVWVALDRGISYLMFRKGVDFHTYDRWTLGSLYDACRWQGKLLLATNQGVFAIDEERLSTGTTPEDYRRIAGLSGQTWSFDLIDGRLFVSQNTGLSELHADMSVTKLSDMGGYAVQSVQTGRQKHLFYASYYKLRQLDGRNRMHEVTGLDEAVYRVESDYLRQVWLEHPSKGVYRCRLSADGRSIEQRTLYGGNAGDGLPYKLSLFRVGERVVLFGDDRFFRYDEYGDRLEPDSVLNATFQHIREIRRVVPLDETNFWVLTGRGVWRLHYDGSRHAHLEPCAGIPVANLIYGYEQVAVLDAATSLFCGDNGFELVTSQEVVSPPLPSAPVLESVCAYGRRDDDRWFDLRRAAKIPYTRNSVTFRYTTREGLLPGAQFRHRMVGMDDAWSDPDRTGKAEYARLPRGRYVFEVVVADSFGRWSEPCRYALEILTPWYASGWAIAGYLLAVPLIFYGVWLLVMRFYRRRYLRRLRLQEIVSLRRANKSLQQELESRDAELVAQSSTLVGRNEMILHMRDMVNDFQSRYGSRSTAALSQKINTYVNSRLDTENDWTLFLIKFEQKHSNFFRIMKERYPDLTTSDLRLSACLKMNLCTKEIASMTHLSVRAIENSRYRLRKKLGLTSAQNLNEFLMHVDSQESVPEDDEVQDSEM